MKTRGITQYLFVLIALIVAVKVLFNVMPIMAFDNQDLIINEVYTNPDTGEKEWLELYNCSLDTINLSDYELKDGGSASKKLQGELLPGDYYLYETSSGWLNNSAEIIFLLKKDDYSIIDMVAYGDWQDPVLPQNIGFNYLENAATPLKGKSLSRIPNATDSNVSKADFTITLPTPIKENIIAQYTDSLKIWEIMPEPIEGSSNEFIEIFNISDQQIELDNWCLDDVDGGSTPYCFGSEEVIKPREYLVIYYSQSKISLNDNGDSVRLFDPNGEIKDEIVYEKSLKGHSYNNFSGNWSWSATLTAGLDNMLTFENLPNNEEALLSDISLAKQAEIGEQVLVEGTVSVAPGMLSKQYFYMQDNSGGIQIYSYHALFPEINIGDVIRVSGEISQISGEKRIKIFSFADIQILENLIDKNDPVFVEINNLNDELIGVNIATAGIVKETSGSTFIIAETSELKVVIKNTSQVKKPRMKKGQKVYVEGILSVYNGQYRLLPYHINGVKILTSGNLPITGRDIKKWNLYLTTKNKQQSMSPILFQKFVAEMFCVYLAIWVAAKQLRLRQLQNIWE